MSDERFDRIERLLADLIGMVGKNNSMVQSIQQDMQDVKRDAQEAKTASLDVLHKLQVMERRQDKLGSRLENLEAEVDIMQEGKQ